MLKTLFPFMCYILIINAAGVSFIKPCKPSDKACMISSAQSAIEHFWPGDPELKLPSLDPLSIGEIRNHDLGLTLDLSNVVIYGVSKCKILDMSRDLAKSTINITGECPITGKGQYFMKGKLIFVEALGNGDFDISSNRVILHMQTKMKTIEKSGVKHWKIVGFEYSYDLVEKVVFKLENLFDGDEKRAKPLLEIINHAWKEMVIEVGDPLIKQIYDKICHIVNKFFLSVPAESLEILE